MIALSYTLTSILTFILAVGAQTPINPNSVRLIPGNRYDKCLTAEGSANGAQVTIQPCTGDSSQLWTFEGGAVKLYSKTKCLDVKDGVDADGTKLQIYDCFSGNTNQQFYYTRDNRLAWTDRGKCADLTDGKLTNGNVIQVWTCVDGNTNQIWNSVAIA